VSSAASTYAASQLYEVNPDRCCGRWPPPPAQGRVSDAADAGWRYAEALSVGALCERVAALGYDGMYDARSA
jgi:hypothetical protein